MGAARIGISGAGFVGSGLRKCLKRRADMVLTRMLSRRRPADDDGLFCDSIDELVDHADLIVECTGDIDHACNVVEAAFAAGLPVVTMNAEFQVTAGSYYVGKGRITEGRGDQPGSLAALAEEVRAMGFSALVYGSQKGFLNLTPDLETMRYWADRQGIGLSRVVSFTDGTKLQIEHALVANGLGATIAQPELLGQKNDDLRAGAFELAEEALRLGEAISDYVLQPGGSGEVFIVANHEDDHADVLRYLKMGEGPNYLFVRPYHLCHFELISTIERCLAGGSVLLDNGAEPRIGVAAVAKRTLKRGEVLGEGIGSFDVRGIAVPIAAFPDHVPIGLFRNCKILNEIAPGQLIERADVAISDGPSSRAWEDIRSRVVRSAALSS
ncbi:MAG TPA: hypothetical protein VKN76_13975 [Kiloniellaceae bacterium]|nr:hypothetical protein [Kiloniellaceae bacterium]